MNKKKAFTLMELLIAMLIFALISVMLIPNVTKNAEKNLFETQLKKIQNDVQQAFLWIMSENQGSMKTVCINAANPNECLRNLIAQGKLETVVSYDFNAIDNNNPNPLKNSKTQADAYVARDVLFLNNNSVALTQDVHNNFYAVNLKNGATLSAIFDNQCNQPASTFVSGAGPTLVCGYIEIDVNGGKVPNVVGKDVHYFWIIDRDGIVPFGDVDAFTCGAVDVNGNITTLPENSNTLSEQFGCTARIINRGKIDFY